MTSAGFSAAAAEAPDSLSRFAGRAGVEQHRFGPMHRRIDREINRLVFAQKGETALGLTVSYGTIDSDDTDFMLVLDNINLKGSIFTINPAVGYFVRDNLAVGLRLGYSDLNANLRTAGLDLGSAMDIDLSLNDITLKNRAFMAGAYLRSYAGLDAKGRFALFGEAELSVRGGKSTFSYMTDGRLKTTRSEDITARLAFNPGLAVYITPNMCFTTSVGLGGVEYTKVTQRNAQGVRTGSREASKMRFRVNLLNINIGVVVHLFSKKES